MSDISVEACLKEGVVALIPGVTNERVDELFVALRKHSSVLEGSLNDNRGDLGPRVAQIKMFLSLCLGMNAIPAEFERQLIEHVQSKQPKSLKWIVDSARLWCGTRLVASFAAYRVLNDRVIVTESEASQISERPIKLIRTAMAAHCRVAVQGTTGSGKTFSTVHAAGTFTPSQWDTWTVRPTVHRLCFYMTANELCIEDQLDAPLDDDGRNARNEKVCNALVKLMNENFVVWDRSDNTKVPLARLFTDVGDNEVLALTVIVDEAGEYEQITSAVTQLEPEVLLRKLLDHNNNAQQPRDGDDSVLLLDRFAVHFIVTGTGINTQGRPSESRPSMFTAVCLEDDTEYDVFLHISQTSKSFVDQLPFMQRQSLQNRRMAVLAAQNVKEMRGLLRDDSSGFPELPSHVVQAAFTRAAVRFKSLNAMNRLSLEGLQDTLWFALQVLASHTPFAGSAALHQLERNFGLVVDQGKWLGSVEADVRVGEGWEIFSTSTEPLEQTKFVAPKHQRYLFPPSLYAIMMLLVWGDRSTVSGEALENATQTAMTTLLMMCTGRPLSSLFDWMRGSNTTTTTAVAETDAAPDDSTRLVVGSVDDDVLRKHFSDANTICLIVPRSKGCPYADLVVLVGSTALLIQCKDMDNSSELSPSDVADELGNMGRGWTKEEAVSLYVTEREDVLDDKVCSAINSTTLSRMPLLYFY